MCLVRRPLVGVLAGLLLFSGTAVADRGHGDREFDIQAHRGGLDLQITEDGQAVVTHDRRVTGTKCLDTAPVTPGDPEFPYVGKYVRNLTLAQVRTLDCGTLRLSTMPAQQVTPGSRMPLLREVFGLVKRHHADCCGG